MGREGERQVSQGGKTVPMKTSPPQGPPTLLFRTKRVAERAGALQSAPGTGDNALLEMSNGSTMEGGTQKGGQRDLGGGENLPNTLPEPGQCRTCTAAPKVLDLQKKKM